MDSVTRIIFDANIDDYQNVFCEASDITEIVETKPRYKSDQKHFDDPDFQDATFIDSERVRLLELAFMVIFQFGARVGTWITRKARERRVVESYFSKAAERES